MSDRTYRDYEGNIHDWPEAEGAPLTGTQPVPAYVPGPAEPTPAERASPVARGFEQFAEQAEAQAAEGRGLRYNAGKVRVDLLPPDAMMALAQLMTINEHKYPDRNWEKGMPLSDILASAERHLLALKAGEDIDPTDNQHHAIKIMWNGMAAYCYWLRGIGTDDRVRVTLPEMRPLPNATR